MTGWLDSLRSDLATPDRLEDPERCQREAEAVERLMVSLTTRQLFVPDEDAEVLLRAAAESQDKENGYAEVVAAHDALHGLLAVVEGGES
jgi:predicted GNAT family acetyltransferase